MNQVVAGSRRIWRVKVLILKYWKLTQHYTDVFVCVQWGIIQ